MVAVLLVIAIKNLGKLSKKILDAKGNITLPGNVKITGDLDTTSSIFWTDRKGVLEKNTRNVSNIFLHNKYNKKTVYIQASGIR